MMSDTTTSINVDTAAVDIKQQDSSTLRNHTASTLSSSFSSSSASSSSSKLSPSDFHSISAYLYSALNLLFDYYENTLDELGLILSAPTTMATATTATTATIASSSSSQPSFLSDPAFLHSSFSISHPAPASFLVLQSQNASCPPFIVAEGSKLGVAFWSIPFLIKQAQKRFSKIKQIMINNVGKIAGLNQHDSSSTTEESVPLHIELLRCTRILLLINADHYTAWNARKTLLLTLPDQLSSFPLSSTPSTTTTTTAASHSFRSELRFLNLVYSKHPKSGESWSHRRWVLARMERQEWMKSSHSADSTTTTATNSNASSSPSSLYSSPLFQSELSICERTALIYPKNYYAWMHRIWLCTLLRKENCTTVTDTATAASASIDSTTSTSLVSHDLTMELDRIRNWNSNNINEHCGFHYRSFIWIEWINARIKEIKYKLFIKSQPIASNAAPMASTLTKEEMLMLHHEGLEQKMREWSRDDYASIPSSTPSAAISNIESLILSSSSSSVPLVTCMSCCPLCSSLLLIEWPSINELQCSYPGHETLWMYRRMIWGLTIMALKQHQCDEKRTELENTGSSSSSSPSFPSFLLPLIQREHSYADSCIADNECSNHIAHSHFARIYKVFVLASALAITYQQEKIKDGKASAANSTASSTSLPYSSMDPNSFPLIPLLSSFHRSWYESLISNIIINEPTIMTKNHWMRRMEALQLQSSQSEAQLQQA